MIFILDTQCFHSTRAELVPRPIHDGGRFLWQIGRLCDAGVSGVCGLYLTIKINFQGKGGSVEYSKAILAATQMALYFAGHLGCKASFQIFTNQADRCLAVHAHGGSPPWTYATRTAKRARRKPKPFQAVTIYILQIRMTLNETVGPS